MKTVFTVVACVLALQCQAAADLDPPLRGEWVRTAEAPLSARDGAVIAWAGGEILVVGGRWFGCPIFSIKGCQPPSRQPPLRDGAAYNPVDDSWRRIAEAPVSISSGTAATIGAAVFVLASTSFNSNAKSLLRYRPAEDRWAHFSLPQEILSPDIAAAGAATLLYFSRLDEGLASDWALDTLTGQWTRLPEDPLGPALDRRFIGVGEDIYLFERALAQDGDDYDGPDYLRAARYRQQRWEILPVSDSFGVGPALVAGTRIAFPQLGCMERGEFEGARPYGRCVAFGTIFDTATDSWHELPDSPLQGPGYIGSAGGLGERELVLNGGSGPALDLVDNRWFRVPQLFIRENIERYARAAGPYGFAFGGSDEAGELLTDTWIWKP
jgi:hypothetical protein